jgi:hypothetical protein
MFSRSLVLMLGLVIYGIRAAGQEHREVKPTSCAEADSLLGPLAKDEARVRLRSQYLPARDTSIWTTGPRSWRGGQLGFVLTLKHAGRSPAEIPGGQLMVMFPMDVFAAASKSMTSLLLILDDSLALDLGAPQAPTVDRGAPRELPLGVFLHGSAFHALARAQSARAGYGGHEVRARRRELRAFRALFRTLLCALYASDAYPVPPEPPN